MADDLRGWLTEIEGIEELKKLDGADWDLEIGGLTALNWKKDGPALLFDKVKGHPEGWRVLTCSTSTRSRTALTLGLPHDSTDKQLVEAVRQRLPEWQTSLDEFAPKLVRQGPVMENIWEKDEIDLTKFPTPKWHEKDGGRYIGTGHLVITRDPDTGEVNLGTYRVMLHDAKTVGIHISPGKHGQLHIQNYHSRGQPCPIALSLGQHPLLFWFSTMTVPEGDEYSYVGAIRGKPVEVIEEPVTGLPVPADSEIVLAGWCPPGKRKTEGPFGEFTGYYAGGALSAPYIEVERVYFRNNPIMLGSPPGRPPNDTEYCHSLLANVMFENELKRSGIPGVKGVWTHDIIGSMFLTVSIQQRYAGHARQAGLMAASLPVRGIMAGRYIIIVDDDIDVTNLKDVLWALCTRSNPEKDIQVLHNLRSTPLDPMIRKPSSLYVQSKAVIDACRPFDWRNEFPEPIEFSPEVVDNLRQKWGAVLNL